GALGDPGVEVVHASGRRYEVAEAARSVGEEVEAELVLRHGRGLVLAPRIDGRVEEHRLRPLGAREGHRLEPELDRIGLGSTGDEEESGGEWRDPPGEARGHRALPK